MEMDGRLPPFFPPNGFTTPLRTVCPSQFVRLASFIYLFQSFAVWMRLRNAELSHLPTAVWTLVGRIRGLVTSYIYILLYSRKWWRKKESIWKKGMMMMMMTWCSSDLWSDNNRVRTTRTACGGKSVKIHDFSWCCIIILCTSDEREKANSVRRRN